MRFSESEVLLLISTKNTILDKKYIYIYSRIPLNPYFSVDGSGYGLLDVMGYEGSILM